MFTAVQARCRQTVVSAWSPFAEPKINNAIRVTGPAADVMRVEAELREGGITLKIGHKADEGIVAGGYDAGAWEDTQDYALGPPLLTDPGWPRAVPYMQVLQRFNPLSRFSCAQFSSSRLSVEQYLGLAVRLTTTPGPKSSVRCQQSARCSIASFLDLRLIT